MHWSNPSCIAAALSLCFVPGALAQQGPATTKLTAVPRLIRFTGAFPAGSNQVTPGVLGAHFAIYSEQEGGTALWSEDQNVTVDSSGNYIAVLGSTTNEGVPAELFLSNESRWLDVQFQTPGAVPQPRILLASVPYAFKAANADTLGGLPPSAYLRVASGTETVTSSGSGVTSNATAAATSLGAAYLRPMVSSGTPNTLGMFAANGIDLTNSLMFQSGNTIVNEVDGGSAFGPTLVLKNAGGLGIGQFDFFTYPGQTVPSARWQAADVGNFTADQVFYTSRGGSANQPLVQRMIIKGSGNVGIGANTNPPDALTVQGNITAEVDGGAALGPIINLKNTGGTGIGQFDFYTYPGQTVPSARWQAADVGNFTADQVFYTSVGGSANQPLAQRMIIKGSGNVGIGTSTPAAKLEVNGTAQIDGNLIISGTILDSGSASPVFLAPTSSTNFSAGVGAMPASTGVNNTAVGDGSLAASTSGFANTAVGTNALAHNMSGSSNVAIGASALGSNVDGQNNVAVGNQALSTNVSGNSNLAFGASALAGATGSGNIGIGGSAGLHITGGSNNIEIGSIGASSDAGVIRIGTSAIQLLTFIAGIQGVTTGNNNTSPVVIDANGQLGTISSSRRFKEDIQDMGSASEGLMQLRPVIFRYKKPFNDGSKPIQYGLIAEEVADVYPDLVVRSAEGQVETVKYQVLDSMLLNEVQKQRATIANQAKEIESLQERLARLEAAFDNQHQVVASAR